MGCKIIYKVKNEITYYKFIGPDGNDYTDYFSFIGRRTTLNKNRVIRSTVNVRDMYNMFHNNIHFTLYSLPWLSKAQNDIDACNNGKGCSAYCGNANISECEKIRKHSHYMRLQEIIQEIINTPLELYQETK